MIANGKEEEVLHIKYFLYCSITFLMDKVDNRKKYIYSEGLEQQPFKIFCNGRNNLFSLNIHKNLALIIWKIGFQ